MSVLIRRLKPVVAAVFGAVVLAALLQVCKSHTLSSAALDSNTYEIFFFSRY